MKKALVPLFILSLALNANAAEYTKDNTKLCIQREIVRICDLNKNPITGTLKYYYKNGKLQSEGNFKDGKLEGLFKVYYENGNLAAEANFKDGKFEGLAKVYYENGNLKSEIFFKEGNPISGYQYDIHGKKTKMTNAHLHNVVKYLK